jgi:hypothetical protein
MMGRIIACMLMLFGLCATPGARGQEGSAGGVPQAAVEREMLVRFSRAYGMAKGALEEHEPNAAPPGMAADLLRDPDQLEPGLREQIYEIMDQNRVEPEEWQAMFVQMDADPDLRQRIESLSIPFGY